MTKQEIVFILMIYVLVGLAVLVTASHWEDSFIWPVVLVMRVLRRLVRVLKGWD